MSTGEAQEAARRLAVEKLCLYHRGAKVAVCMCGTLLAYGLARERAGLEKAAKAVVDACSTCDGNGWVETVTPAHAPDCDGACRNCPVPVQDREGCEYCGRPASAIRALME